MKIIVEETNLTYEGLNDFHNNVIKVLETSISDVILDFQKITMTLDSSAIGELMKFHTYMEKRNLFLHLANVNKLTKTVFRLNKLDTILNLIDSE